MIDIQGGTNSAITLQARPSSKKKHWTTTTMKTKKIRFTKMQMRHIKTSLMLEVMMNFQGDLPNDQEDDGTKLEPFFVGFVR